MHQSVHRIAQGFTTVFQLHAKDALTLHISRTRSSTRRFTSTGSLFEADPKPRRRSHFSRLGSAAIRHSQSYNDAYEVYATLHDRAKSLPLSFRLITTTFVHHMIRLGEPERAVLQVEEIISSPTNALRRDLLNKGNLPRPTPRIIRSDFFPPQTLEALIRALCAESTLHNSPAQHVRPHHLPIIDDFGAEPNHVRSTSQATRPFLDPRTRLALSLLHTLRERRHRRTSNMYQHVIHACLHQRDIVTASLLFGLIAKDHQVKSILAQARERTRKQPFLYWHDQSLRGRSTFNSPTTPVLSLANVKTAEARRLGLRDVKPAIPIPSEEMLSPIVAALSHTFRMLKPDPGARAHAAEALGYLLRMLHEGAIPYVRIGPLVRLAIAYVESPLSRRTERHIVDMRRFTSLLEENQYISPPRAASSISDAPSTAIPRHVATHLVEKPEIGAHMSVAPNISTKGLTSLCHLVLQKLLFHPPKGLLTPWNPSLIPPLGRNVRSLLLRYWEKRYEGHIPGGSRRRVPDASNISV